MGPNKSLNYVYTNNVGFIMSGDTTNRCYSTFTFPQVISFVSVSTGGWASYIYKTKASRSTF
jgi:hypothetical protein